MVERRAIPCAMIIRTMLKTELNLECRMGATYGKAYCGVVGGIRRHEYAILGPSVNLAARLMAHSSNRGFLVDEAVKEKAGSRTFEALEPVFAKGYANPVPIFVPISERKRIDWKGSQTGFAGRENERKDVTSFARQSTYDRNEEASMVIITAEEGCGKTSLLAQSIEDISEFCRGENISAIVSAQSFDEGCRLDCFG
jgi:hypothetical protein